MEKTVALLLADGFEEGEAIVIMDVLNRLQIKVDLLACQSSPALVGYWGLPIRTDSLLNNHLNDLYDAVVLPGGPQGARSLGANPQVVDFIKRHQVADKWICSICSAGAHVLAANHLLQGKRYVCSGDNYKLYTDGYYVDQPIVEDGKILTGKGLGVAFEFAFAVGAKLIDPAIAQAQAEHIYFDHWKAS